MQSSPSAPPVLSLAKTSSQPLSLPRLLAAAGGVYTAQSLVGGLTFLGLPAILRAEDVALDQIGLVSLAMLVWAVKFLWAPPVERLRMRPDGQRLSRRLVLVGEALVVAALLLFGLNAGAGFPTLLALLILMAIASATVDIVCDAFVIEQFSESRRGIGNVAQVGGGYLGMIFGSGLFVAAYSSFGWMAASFMLAGLVALLSIPMATIREPKGEPFPRSFAPSLGNGLRRKEVQIGIAMTIALELGGRMAQALAGPFLVDAGLPLTTLGVLNGIGGVAAGLAGTALGGLLAHRLRARQALFAVASAHVVTLGLLAIAIICSLENLPLLASLFVIESAMMAATFVTSYSRVMGLASPSQPGVDFTLFQSASAITAALCGMAAGILAAGAGYAVAFGLAAIFAALAPLLLFVFEKCLMKGTRT
jgi:MFS transporter, putative signal transducer